MQIKNNIVILDFGSQYTQLIARRIRQIGVFCTIANANSIAKIIDYYTKGIILSGGPDTINKKGASKIPDILFKANIPILGICYGMQVLAVQLGGQAKSSIVHEYGPTILRARGHSILLKDVYDSINDKGHNFLDVWMSHGIEISKLPPNTKLIASSDNCQIAGFADESRSFYGIQFHPEVTHTKQGINIFKNFVFNICNCHINWQIDNTFINKLTNKLKIDIANNKVLLALSGGVDSTVSAYLLHKAIGDNLVCIFVDNGLLRLNEKEKINKLYKKTNNNLNIIYVDAKDKFYKGLKGVYDPEQKRKIIGKLFIDVFVEKTKDIPRVKYLAQGTIYPDIIESGGGNTKTIKSHHNVGGLPKKLGFSLIEPLKNLFKDEVRKLGVKLLVPEQILTRHPFPGPGLAVRIVGEITEQYVKILQQADNVFITKLEQNNLYNKVSQAFCVFLPIKSVGVTGDNRRYGYVIALRSVTTTDFMTAQVSELPQSFISEVANEIINKIPEISRVVLDVSSKPPATIEWE